MSTPAIMNNFMGKFAVFILTHGRPDRVITYRTLRKQGYTGRIILLVDDMDSQKDEYVKNFGDEVYVFPKSTMEQDFDMGDNFSDKRGVIWARNANFSVAEKLGIKYFIQLDDDYQQFELRFSHLLEYGTPYLKDGLDAIFTAMVRFYIVSGCHSVAMAQGGDFLGGSESPKAQKVQLMRKCMNSFVCSTDRPFKFIGRINEDVNTYVHLGSKGMLFFTTSQVSLVQRRTQQNAGGMTELYLDSGTYVKSFYSVMYQPSSVKIRVLNSTHPRIHHAVKWKNTVPCILRETVKKSPN